MLSKTATWRDNTTREPTPVTQTKTHTLWIIAACPTHHLNVLDRFLLLSLLLTFSCCIARVRKAKLTSENSVWATAQIKLISVSLLFFSWINSIRLLLFFSIALSRWLWAQSFDLGCKGPCSRSALQRQTYWHDGETFQLVFPVREIFACP